jgi:O-antigen ligase
VLASGELSTLDWALGRTSVNTPAVSATDRKGRAVRGALLAAGASLAGVLVLLLASSKPASVVLLAVALAGVAVLFLLRDLVLGLLCTYVLVAPVAISKALAVGAGVYAPALEVTVSDVCLFALVPLWLARKWSRGEPLVAHRFAIVPVALFFGWAWMSALHAGVISHGLLAALNLSKSFLVFVVLSDMLDSPRRLRWVLCAAAAGLALQATMAGAQLITKSQLLLPGMKTTELATLGISMRYVGGDRAVDAFRPFGFLQHPVFLASYLVMALPLPLMLVLVGPRRTGRWIWRVALALLLAGSGALVATLSRGGWIALAVAVAFLFVAGIRMRLVRWRQLAIAAGLAVAGVLGTMVAYPSAYYRLTQSDDRSSESRFLMMKQAVLVIRKAPLLGVGLASYTDAAKHYQPTGFSAYSPEFRKKISAGVVHNAYLAFWAERGLVGIATVVVLYGYFLRAVLRKRRWRTPMDRAIAVGLAGGLVGQLAMYNFDHAYLDSRPGVLWLLFALLAAVMRLQEAPVIYLSTDPAVESGEESLGLRRPLPTVGLAAMRHADFWQPADSARTTWSLE